MSGFRGRSVLPADVQQMLVGDEEPEERSPGLAQKNPEPPHIKEEQEGLWSSQEGEKLQGLEGSDIIKFTFSPAPVKTEDDEEKPQSSRLHQIQTEQMEKGADEEDFGGPEQARSSDPEGYLHPEIEVKIEESSEAETDASDDWEDTREDQLGLNSAKDIKDKRKRCDKKSHSCSECGKIFNQKSHLTDHMRIHTGEKPFGCSECGKRFNHQRCMTRHLLVHTREKTFTCSECGKGFSQKGNMIRHMRLHKGEQPFSCSVCSKRFNEKSGLTAHMANHRGEQPFSCSVCGKRFNFKGNLAQHMVVHTGEKLYSCSYCVKSFKHKSCLTRHMAHHRGEKPFSCNNCNRKFSLHAHLIMHTCISDQERHLQPEDEVKTAESSEPLTDVSEHWKLTDIYKDTKSHSCSQCNKTFKKKHALIRHMRIHTKEKPFSCSECGKRFSLKGNLTQHVVIHTGEKPYICSVCNQRFAWHKLFKKHKCVAEWVSALHQNQAEETGEVEAGPEGGDCGGSEQDWNSDPERILQPETEIKTENSPEPVAAVSDDWMATREH
ncbi:gastrula zinc finger protein XlCGF57.1-like [Cheilinus undulatus]|uniref:gastrula zinc finger protein XlCGF57.1-like n=1 Tax=Cheilinus undulatus TaxID=241271 RepID=UPI001BD4E392|nr:gastrula zinc finger protein XlCGF57.1-like [Cheilinus undulatus]